MSAFAELLVTDDSVRPNTIAFRDADGTRMCAACGCREDQHCLICGCQTRAGADDECLCAKFVAEIAVCPDCGHLFRTYWQMQVHRMPSPRCLISARAAAGLDGVAFEPPLRNQTAQRVADKTRKI